MPYKPHKVEKLYYTIGEIATIFEVNTSLIRYWEKEFQKLSPKKNKKGDRVFTKEDIEDIRLIYHLLKERGYTIEGAKVILKTQGKRAKNTLEAIDSLKRVKTFLQELSSQL